ncbi:MAG TPA: TRAP transporter TatT component family protein [Blastocatellia bacterium]
MNKSLGIEEPNLAATPAEAAARLDEIYRRRAASRPSPAIVNKLASLPFADDSYDVQWRLARAMFILGEQAREYFGCGIKHGRQAVTLNGSRVEGHFWLGVNQALCAEQDRGPRAAILVIKARTHLRRAVLISESYHGAGPLRVLARLDHKAPRLLGGNRKRSRAYYERALAIAPKNSVTRLYAAELAIDDHDLPKAACLLREIVRLPIDPEWEGENERDKLLARSLLATIE